MSRTTWFLALSLAAGCSAQPDEFKSATPSQSAITLTVQGGGTTSTASAGESQSALTGATASLYTFTRDVSRAVNGGIVAILSVVERITDQPAASREANKAVWGPLTDALDPATYLLVVEKVGPHDYTYVLSGKPKGADDSQYKPVMAGNANVVDETHGSGDFLLDFSAIHALDPTSQPQGGIAVHYSNVADPRNVEVAFKDFVDQAGGTPSNALYRYAEHPDHSGNFEFATKADLNHDGLDEDLAVVSRWNASGAGRSDAVATGGSLGPDTAHVEECWDQSFAESYYTDDLNLSATSGDASTCAF